jgi:hypothetical protein
MCSGTASKKQMEANMKYTQRAVVFATLTTSTLDHLDGLTIKPGTQRSLCIFFIAGAVCTCFFVFDTLHPVEALSPCLKTF